jgi:hypothetical protein
MRSSGTAQEKEATRTAPAPRWASPDSTRQIGAIDFRGRREKRGDITGIGQKRGECHPSTHGDRSSADGERGHVQAQHPMIG